MQPAHASRLIGAGLRLVIDRYRDRDRETHDHAYVYGPFDMHPLPRAVMTFNIFGARGLAVEEKYQKKWG